MKTKCPFCQAPMLFATDFCQTCKVSIYSENDKIIVQMFSLAKGDSYYEIWLDFKNNRTQLVLAGCDIGETLLYIDSVMHITPANIKEKLNTLLTFL